MRIAALCIVLAAQVGPTESTSNFDQRLRLATGPAQLRELDAWCAKNRNEEGRKKVRELLARITPPAKPAGDARAREGARVQSGAAHEAVSEYREGRARSAAAELGKIVEAMETGRHAPPELSARILDLAKGLLADAPPELSALGKRLAALKHEERPGEEASKAAAHIDGQVKALLRKFTGQIFSAVEKCLAAGEAGHAFDLYRFLLQVDPDNDRAHRSLGETKVDGRWLRPFDVQQQRLGLLWDGRRGWVPLKQKDRLEAGEIWDPNTKQWGKPADLDKLRSEPGQAWRIESEHFELVSTADLELSVRLLARMEAFFLQAFRQYDLFFTGKGGGKAASLVFGVAPSPKKLKVNFYRDADQFRKHAKPPTAWAAGFYSGSQGASFFHASGSSFSADLVQHELTHQILGEYSDGGSGGGPWLAEGAAVYLECAEFRNGTLSLGRLKDNRLVAQYRKNLRGGMKEHSLRYMLETFGPGGNWDQGDISKNYRGAGAAVHFLMTFDGGRYRGDAIALLRDAYFAKPRPLEDYTGISVEGLDFLMDRYYRDCDVP
jgi:hypothetical protein